MGLVLQLSLGETRLPSLLIETQILVEASVTPVWITLQSVGGTGDSFVEKGSLGAESS